MGNSLQDYRCRIGSFMNNRGRKKKDVLIKRNKVKKWKSLKFIPTLIFMSSLFFIFIHSTGENINATKAIKSTFKFPVYFPPCSVEVINSNFQARYKFGNIQKNGIKIMHCNGGGNILKTRKIVLKLSLLVTSLQF